MDIVVAVIGGVACLVLIGITVVLAGHRAKKKQPKQNQVQSTPQVAANGDSADIILEAIDDGVVLVDAQGTIKIFNPAAARITGWQQTETVGLNHQLVLKLVNTKDVAYSIEQNPFERVLREHAAIRDNETVLVSKSDRRISLSLTVSPLISADGAAYGAVAVFRDVSTERQQETQRAEFISTASHEMRTPIAAIEGYLSLVVNNKQSPLDEKTKAYLDKAYDATRHLGKLFQDLLTSSQAEDGRMVANPQITDIGSLVENLAQDLHFAAEKHGMQLELLMGSTSEASGGHTESERVLSPLYYSFVDPDRLREVVSNLFDNAVKYSPGGGKVSIGLTGNAEVVQIYVKDTGMGIAPEDLPHLFQKFYRVDNSDTRTIGGTGLGLFICRMIIEQANGKIWAASEPGQGSTFFVNLPRLSQAQMEAMQRQAAENATLVKPLMVQ